MQEWRPMSKNEKQIVAEYFDEKYKNSRTVFRFFQILSGVTLTFAAIWPMLEKEQFRELKDYTTWAALLLTLYTIFFITPTVCIRIMDDKKRRILNGHPMICISDIRSYTEDNYISTPLKINNNYSIYQLRPERFGTDNPNHKCSVISLSHRISDKNIIAFDTDIEEYTRQETDLLKDFDFTH